MSGHPASFDAPAPKMKTVLLIFVPNLAPHRAPHSAGLLSRSRRPGRIWMYGASRNAKFPEGWPHELVAGHPPREKRAESRSQRGYRPTAIRIRRSTTRLSRLSFSSRAVAVPSGVSGSITAPRSRKWSSQPLVPRMEEPDERSAPGIDRANVATLPCVAPNAGIREVAGIRRSAVLTANDVVDLMRRIRIVFVEEAILTARRGAFRDESAQ
jgi:hypothetical protein